MKKPFHAFCVIGRSGSGKGTQVELLQKKLPGLVHITTSDLLKQLVKTDKRLGPRVQALMKKGDLVPSWLVVKLWLDVLTHIPAKASGIIWEGSPRHIWEAEVMDDAVPFLFGIQPVPIYIDISETEAKERLSKRLQCVKCKQLVPYKLLDAYPKTCSFCNGKLIKRPDDTPKAIQGRMRFFKRDVVPALVRYQKQKRLIVVNGEQSADAAFRDFWAALKKRKLM